MPGSKSEASLVLLHNFISGETTWAIKSAARRAKEAVRHKYFIVWEGDPNYQMYLEAAGPKPKMLIEEVTHSTVKQGADNGKEAQES